MRMCRGVLVCSNLTTAAVKRGIFTITATPPTTIGTYCHNTWAPSAYVSASDALSRSALCDDEIWPSLTGATLRDAIVGGCDWEQQTKRQAKCLVTAPSRAATGMAMVVERGCQRVQENLNPDITLRCSRYSGVHQKERHRPEVPEWDSREGPWGGDSGDWVNTCTMPALPFGDHLLLHVPTVPRYVPNTYYLLVGGSSMIPSRSDLLLPNTS